MRDVGYLRTLVGLYVLPLGKEGFGLMIIFDLLFFTDL